MKWTITPSVSTANSLEFLKGAAKKIFRVLRGSHPDAMRTAHGFLHKKAPIEVYTREQVTAVCQCLHYYGVGYEIHKITRVDIDEFPVGREADTAPA